MKSLCLTFLSYFCFCISVVAGEPVEPPAKSILALSQNRTEFLLLLENSIENISVETFTQTTAFDGRKSVGKAVLFSAAIPGTGEIYAGSYLKGAVFLVVEAATIVGQVHFQNRGNDLESQFEANADLLWSEDAYWDWMSDVGNINRSRYGSDEEWLTALRVFERGRFSHFLPEEINQQYYENIGKYNQFIMGWQDFRGLVEGDPELEFTLSEYDNGHLINGKDLLTISQQRNSYTSRRKDANDNFKRATTMATVTLFNHVLSALDAGLTVKRHNRKVMQMNIRMQGRLYNRELIPAVTLGVTW